MKKKKVLMAMSGGVDSSVSALLLKERGFDVTGITMCLGVKDIEIDRQRCCGPQTIKDAQRVCHKLGIPHLILDSSHDFEEKVIARFIDEYLKGRTPNPCIECNKYIKFDTLIKKAIALGFDYFATGHYAKVENQDGQYLLRRPKDEAKDQTYFLYPIGNNYLRRILFPLATLAKEDVRGIARDANLHIADKPQSQDICFIPGKNYRSFIERRVEKIEPGPIVDLMGERIGQHEGICFYTVGQREGLGISWKEPLYVISIDAEKNQIIVGEKSALKAKGLVAGNLNLFVRDFPKDVFAKIRYAHKEAKCDVSYKDGKLRVLFSNEQESITPGQSVVLYHDDIVLGGGVIEESIMLKESINGNN